MPGSRLQLSFANFIPADRSLHINHRHIFLVRVARRELVVVQLQAREHPDAIRLVPFGVVVVGSNNLGCRKFVGSDFFEDSEGANTKIYCCSFPRCPPASSKMHITCYITLGIVRVRKKSRNC
jgi:hypothetical protein